MSAELQLAPPVRHYYARTRRSQRNSVSALQSQRLVNNKTLLADGSLLFISNGGRLAFYARPSRASREVML